MSRNPRRAKRHAAPISASVQTLGRCEGCEKDKFETRRIARDAAKARHPGERLSAYRCPLDEDVWHYGHLKAVVRNGHLPRETLELEAQVRARRAEGRAHLEAESA